MSIETRPITFTIPGEPVSKARPRYTKGGGAYTPAKTREFEEKVGWLFRKHAPGHQPTPNQKWFLDVEFIMGTKQRRDVDNMVKAIGDALNGIAWADDDDIVWVNARKMFADEGEEPRTIVMIWSAGEHKPRRSCDHCGARFQTWPSIDAHYCSQTCAYEGIKQRNIAERGPCPICGKPIKKPGNKTCGKDCGYKLRRRKSMARTHCKHGHEWTDENTYWHDGSRYCIACRDSYAKTRKR